ncbi:MAG: hypothetical protein FJ098_15875, partial [Deltaproteobacteria bacterium]|nr:hypothetical protein [Deltaproteobacteria bacterium]
WVEIVAAVDGLDVIDGDRADYCHKRGYVLSPGSSYDIEGWRTSLSSVDRFRFVHPAASEAARKGTAWSHLGWIQVAFFFGRLSPSPPLLPPPSGAGVFRGEDVEAPAPAEAADLDGRGAHDEARPPAAKSGAWRERSWDPLGTGRGESAWAPAEETSFWRDHETRPDRMINIRYVR